MRVGQGGIEIPLHGTIALRAGRLRDFHGDPADRIIAATAMKNPANLITADERILNRAKPLRTFEARG